MKKIQDSFLGSVSFKTKFNEYPRAVQNAFWEIIKAGHERKLDWYFIRDGGALEVRAGNNELDEKKAEKNFLTLYMQNNQIKFSVNIQYRGDEIGKNIKRFHDHYISTFNVNDICKYMVDIPIVGSGYLPNDFE
ncbi:hypothetical protein [Gluconobacter cerinus]|uniref:hypothetical protein n=1 Tax=Gluconobacter cerinus TaxID=38307 RepID=UPI001C0520D4|nr:hypothetical protein [Gluconobacter cerinus]